MRVWRRRRQSRRAIRIKGSLPVKRPRSSRTLRTSGLTRAFPRSTLVARARAKLVGYESQYKALKSQALMVPQVEAEFTQLNRDYDVQKRTYESLLARRESAAMGKDVQDSGGARFRVIDPPRVSPEPVP